MSDDILQEKNVRLKRSGRAASGLKKILGHGSGLFEDTDSPQSSRGDCNVAIIKDKSKAIGKPGQKYHPDVMLKATEALNAGMSGREVQERFDTHASLVRAAFERRHVDPMRAKRALLNLVTENALATQVVAATKVEDLSAAQAVFAGKLLAETMMDLDKHIQDAPRVLDFRVLKDVGDSIKDLKAMMVDSATMT